ncbi:MAG TPA: hypothetical protein VF713_25000 [Thermoanaerobaculia bacterium]
MFKLENLIVLAGIGQLCVVLASLAIPRLLDWPRQLQRLEPLTRQVFWTYAGYILATNLFFAMASLLASGSLAGHSPRAAALTTFMALYWAARVAVQFFFFHRSGAADTFLFRAAEVLYVGGFAFFSAVYAYAALSNMR